MLDFISVYISRPSAFDKDSGDWFGNPEVHQQWTDEDIPTELESGTIIVNASKREARAVQIISSLPVEHCFVGQGESLASVNKWATDAAGLDILADGGVVCWHGFMPGGCGKLFVRTTIMEGSNSDFI